ncbi:dihydrofolate reductase family protein [Teichococcus vastitatis]|jgi:dihydrofolate reductase|uniref:Dihydrofolate reductase family protein n=1 Tax=Teichococcus vastitatis TaxID=2307076 RepID=A0ABS9VZ37_9PROT|nr:dihydrofolate reductase family protein [Pseudoroseomonas vastitatis]MCI0752256.1 dihydrofolate reductase family protein [Pseudoroseomonas vastitatis]
MGATVWHCHIAVSLDGKIARPDGSVDDWLAADYPAEDFGFGAFFAGVDAILMGRGTYDALRCFGDWPYPGKPTIVLTARPLDALPPPGVEARSGDVAAVAAELEARGYRRVWIEGGGQVIRSMIAINKLDLLEMAVIPVILGDGIPLFPAGTGELRLRLARCEAKAKGALHLVYERIG